MNGHVAPAAADRRHVLVSALRLDAAWRALSACDKLLALRCDPMIDARAAPLGTFAPLRDNGRWAPALRLSDQDVDHAAAPAALLGLAGGSPRPGFKQRRLDSWYSADMASSAQLAGLVLVDAVWALQRSLAGAEALLQRQQPWLLVAISDAATVDALKPCAYNDASAQLPAAMHHRWRLWRSARGDDAALSEALSALARDAEHRDGEERVLSLSADDWGWGLLSSPYASCELALQLSPRGHVGLLVPPPSAGPVQWLLQLRRDREGLAEQTPSVLIGGRPAFAHLRWQGLQGRLQMDWPGPRGDTAPLDLVLAWGTRGLLAREHHADSGVELRQLSMRGEG